MYRSCSFIFHRLLKTMILRLFLELHLVGAIPTPLKKFVSWDDDIPKMMGKIKVTSVHSLETH